jgi:hypothetical protein
MKTLLRTASDDNEKNHCSYSNSVTVVSVNWYCFIKFRLLSL